MWFGQIIGGVFVHILVKIYLGIVAGLYKCVYVVW